MEARSNNKIQPQIVTNDHELLRQYVEGTLKKFRGFSKPPNRTLPGKAGALVDLAFLLWVVRFRSSP